MASSTRGLSKLPAPLLSLLRAWRHPAIGIALGWCGIAFPLLGFGLLVTYAAWLWRHMYRAARGAGRPSFSPLVLLVVFLLWWSWLLGLGAGVTVAAKGAGLFLLRPFLEATCAWGIVALHALHTRRRTSNETTTVAM